MTIVSAASGFDLTEQHSEGWLRYRGGDVWVLVIAPDATATGTRFVGAVGDGVETEITVTHGLGVAWPIVQLYDTATGAGVLPAWETINSTQIRLTFEGSPPGADEYTVVIL